MKHVYKIFLLTIILLVSINTINSSTGGFNFINKTNSNVVVSNFSTLGELDDKPTLFYNNTCYTWEEDSNVWTSENNKTGVSTLAIDPGNNFWIGLTDRNLIDDSLSVLNVQVDNEPKIISFIRDHKNGAWDIAGDYSDYIVGCPTDKTILKCLNYPDEHGCKGVTFNDSATVKNSHRKLDLKSIQVKK